jgi:hypothetical protein
MTSRRKDEVLAFAKSTVEQAIALGEQAVERRARSTQSASNRAEARTIRQHRRELRRGQPAAVVLGLQSRLVEDDCLEPLAELK